MFGWNIRICICEKAMRLLSLLFPFLSFILRARPFAALVGLFLQLTIIGWPFAAMWTLADLVSYQNKSNFRRTMKYLRQIEKEGKVKISVGYPLSN
ncbi:hypothetical protein GCM10023187_52570 [Nibrella viscosa]|uniref:Uncharacterized protein n=1 Tax=Nibrella viscosa TaxID=1084524 RepID=A0ABP8KZP7_9BACT